MQTGTSSQTTNGIAAADAQSVQAPPSTRPQRKWEGLSRREIAGRLRAWRRGMWLVGVFSLLVNLLMLTVPVYLLQLSDRVLVSQSYDTLYMLTVGAVGALVALSIFDWVRRLILTRIGLNLEARLGGPLLVAGVRTGVQHDQPDVQPLCDLASVRSFLTGPVVPMFFDLPTIPLYILVVFLIHPQLGFIVIFGSIALFIFALINQAVTSGQVGLSHGHASVALRHAEAQVRNADSVRSMGMITDGLRMWGESNREALHAFRRYSDRNAMVSSFSKLLRLLLQIAVLGWGLISACRECSPPAWRSLHQSSRAALLPRSRVGATSSVPEMLSAEFMRR